MPTLRELLERRAAIAAEMRQINEKPAQNGDLSPEQATRFDALKGELDGLEPRIARQTLVEDTERRMAGHPLHNPGQDRPNAFGTMVQEFRIGAALAGLAGISGVDYGREREVSQEIARRAGKNPNGIFVPMEALAERRAMQANVLTSGGALTATTVVQDVIEPLRAKTVIGKLGATMLTDLTGVIEIPSISQGVPTQWIGEGQTITSQAGPKLGVVRLAPHTVASLCEFSHALLKNSSISVENLLRRDLSQGIALAIDTAALIGSGVGPEPLGIFNMTGVKSRAFNATVNLSNISNDLAAMAGSVLGSNVDETALGWVMHPRAALWFSSVRATDGSSVWPSISMMGLDGRPVGTTTSMPLTNTDTKANGIFGNWRDMVVGMWGVLDLTANPYGEAYKRGGVEVRAIMDTDINVRHIESFVKATNMPVTEVIA